MCSCFKIKPRPVSTNPSNTNESISFSVREITVRLVHAGGRIEMYQRPIPASILTQKYPGMCIAHPTVFKRPHESLLSGDDILLPGNKYFIIRTTTVEKLKRRHLMKLEGSNNEPVFKVGQNDKNDVDESSTNFHVPRDRWSVLNRQVKEKKQFVPPIQRPRLHKEIDWEPSLTSIQEVSL